MTEQVIWVGPRLCALKFPYDEIYNERAKYIPSRKWNRVFKRWEFSATIENFEYIQRWFPNFKWEPKVNREFDDAHKRQELRTKILNREFKPDDFNEYRFKTKPFEHQKTCLALCRDQLSFGFLMDQGTGKSKTLIDDACYNFEAKTINFLLVVCPNSVKTKWVNPYKNGDPDEIDKHGWDKIEINKGCWFSNPNSEERQAFKKFKKNLSPDKLNILVANVECFSGKRPVETIEGILIDKDVMIAVDESTSIKNPRSKRSKNIYKIRNYCKMARILTGTPIIQSPLDAFGQFYFLDEEILGFSNYFSFQHQYAQMIPGHNGRYKKVIGYKNLEELSNRIYSSAYRVLKKDCLDLPNKIYSIRKVSMTKEQSEIYRQMKENAIAIINETTIVQPTIVLDQLMKLQQIISGFLISEGSMVDLCKIPPKIEEAIGIINECSHKVLVWSRFTYEIKLAFKFFNGSGIKSKMFYGDIPIEERRKANEEFLDEDSDLKVIIGNPKAGSRGIDLYTAGTCIYLSNSFETEMRVQSEDRVHRYGLKHPVEYIDLVCDKTVDNMIIKALRQNINISDIVLKDNLEDCL